MLKKYILHTLFAIIILFGALPLYAAGGTRGSVKSMLNVWVEGGVNTLLNGGKDINNSVGGAGGLGFGYEMHKGAFIFTAGLGANISYNPVKGKNAEYVLYDQTDFDPVAPDVLDYHYEMADRQDKYLNLALQIPVLVGFQKGRFYMLGGVKLGYIMNLNTSMNATISSYGDYTRSIGIVRVDNYNFFQGAKISKSGKATFRPDVALSIELGVNLGEEFLPGYNRFRPKHHYRIAVFADYGLTDIHDKSKLAPLSLPQQYSAAKNAMRDGVGMRDILSSGMSGKVNNLLVGIKFTTLFDLPEPRRCTMCRTDLPFTSRYTRGAKKNRR